MILQLAFSTYHFLPIKMFSLFHCLCLLLIQSNMIHFLVGFCLWIPALDNSSPSRIFCIWRSIRKLNVWDISFKFFHEPSICVMWLWVHKYFFSFIIPIDKLPLKDKVFCLLSSKVGALFFETVFHIYFQIFISSAYCVWCFFNMGLGTV